ncbi:hypothetical protein H7F37_09430 [Winogradskyella sp. PAMC22761]|nr:hypothetical protein H7F37_09430 [Winogradskyella sp. PAMC22761]
MKLSVFFTIIFLILMQFSWSQTDPIKQVYNRSYVIFNDCDTADDKEKCYEISLQELVGKQLNHKTFKDSIFYLAKRDTIAVPINILYDEFGVIVKDYSLITNPNTESKQSLEGLLDSIPRVKPVLDTYNKGVAVNISSIFGYFLDRTKDSIIPLVGYEPKIIPFSIIEKAPVYKGCDRKLNNKDLLKCMNSEIYKLISNNFNINLASKLGLSEGLKRIYVTFNVNKKGKVSDIRARGPHPDLEAEAIRVINKIPKLKRPGYFKKKPVKVPYSLPIVFSVTE